MINFQFARVMPTSVALDAQCEMRFERSLQDGHRQTDYFFAGLMIAQWLGGIIAALTFSPYAWFGTEIRLHDHVYASVFLGGAIISLPLCLIFWRPGEFVTRQVVAISQMATSALLIHLCGGRIETHFHAFGSLAFLSFYRDWRVLFTATLVATVDHAWRGAYWPESIYGTQYVSHWRTFEHLGWMLFLNVFLVYSCVRSRNDLKLVVQRQYELELLNESIEARIAERTAELRSRSAELEVATREVSAERELALAADRAKSEFLANMSHEIRTPLTAILGYAELLLEDGDITRAPASRTRSIRTIQSNGDHLLSLVNNILDLSKIEAGGVTAERLACSPRQILAEVLSAIAENANKKGICLTIIGDHELPAQIISDAVRLRQILLNIANNAIKFTSAGSVTISTRYDAASEMLEFDVADTGVGISSAEANSIFKPFLQADTSTTRRFGGTGLGLTISQKLAQLLGGNVVLQHSSPGEGSVFRITIRAAVAADAHGARLTAPVPSSQRESSNSPPAVLALPKACRVLLAEDGPDNQRIFAHFIRNAGASVTIVENGQLAVDAALSASAASQPFDVILMDMQMPILDGYEATAYLRSQAYHGAIIAITAHAMSGDREKCLDAGCDDYLTKPIDRTALIACMARFTIRRRNSCSV